VPLPDLVDELLLTVPDVPLVLVVPLTLVLSVGVVPEVVDALPLMLPEEEPEPDLSIPVVPEFR